MARPKTRLDLDEVEKLGALHCTDEELASFFGVSARTIARRRQSPKFREALERGKARGKINLRRILWKLAQSGQIAAAIFLSKNILQYRDAGSMELSGPGGGPIEIASKPDFSNLNADELKQLRTLAAKTKAR
jgi:hypothetical protein